MKNARGSNKPKPAGSRAAPVSAKSTLSCGKCGREGHVEKTCRVPKCSFCDRLGHREDACWKKGKTQSQRSGKGGGPPRQPNDVVATALNHREQELDGVLDMLRDKVEELEDIYSDTPCPAPPPSITILEIKSDAVKPLPAEQLEEDVLSEDRKILNRLEKERADKETQALSTLANGLSLLQNEFDDRFWQLTLRDAMLSEVVNKPLVLETKHVTWKSVLRTGLCGTLISTAKITAAKWVMGSVWGSAATVALCASYVAYKAYMAKRGTRETYQISDVSKCELEEDSRPDSQSLGEAKHRAPLLATLTYTKQEFERKWYFPLIPLPTTTKVQCKVSLEAAVQASTIKELSLTLPENVVFEKINRVLGSLHSVVWDRYMPLGQEFLFQGTALYAFGLYRAMKAKLASVPFPKPPQ